MPTELSRFLNERIILKWILKETGREGVD